MAELVSIKRNVDVSPGQAAPAVFHCSQGDVGSKIILGLLNNGTAYSIPSGVTVTIEGSESNGSIFTPISATASGSDITFYLTGEMTAVAGPAICQAVLKSGSNILGTANFTLEVESSPMGADAPPVFTDAGWTWMLNKLTTEFVPALGDNIIDAIDGKADQSDLTALSNTVAGHTGSITVLNNTVNNLNQSVTENRQNISRKLDKNQGTANAGKYLKVGADGNVETADLDVTTDKTLSIADKAADAKAVGDELTGLKTDLKLFENNLFYQKEQLTSSEIIAANNNTAVTNNEDGTYSIGTNDNGNTTFGSGRLSLDAGYYLLYGVPNGIAFLSPEGAASKSYNNRVFENISPEPKIIHITESTLLWVCYRVASKPSSEYVIAPSLIKLVPIVDSALKFKGVLESGTDLNNLFDSGIYLLSSDRSYTNAPLTSGYLFVLATVTAIQQICIQYGSGLMSVGAIYKRDGSVSGVTADWHKLGRLFNHNIAFFGDSIMWGRDGSASASTRTSWQIPAIVGNSLQVSTINYGVSGQGYLPTNESPACAYDTISAKNLDNFDTIVLCYGVNDGFHLLGEWDSTDESTIMGQFNKIINYIYTQNPTMRVIVFAPFNGTNIGSYPDYWYGSRNNPPYVSRKVLSDTLKRACDYYWIPYIEQYDSPLNAKTITQLLPDGVHPNDEGYKMIGEWFAGKIRGLLS